MNIMTVFPPPLLFIIMYRYLAAHAQLTSSEDLWKHSQPSCYVVNAMSCSHSRLHVDVHGRKFYASACYVDPQELIYIYHCYSLLLFSCIGTYVSSTKVNLFALFTGLYRIFVEILVFLFMLTSQILYGC